jgi:hypothetical protein
MAGPPRNQFSQGVRQFLKLLLAGLHRAEKYTPVLKRSSVAQW